MTDTTNRGTRLLRAIFGFVDLTDVHVFDANGMDMGPELRKTGQRSAIAEARAFAQSAAWRPAPPVPAPISEPVATPELVPAHALVA